MSKKIAEGIARPGDGRQVRPRGVHEDAAEHARELAEALVAIGRANGVRTEALLTAMDTPLGRTVGNALEVKECVEVLKGGGPADVRELSLALAARMLRLAGVATSRTKREDGEARSASGAGWRRSAAWSSSRAATPASSTIRRRLPAAAKPARGPRRARRLRAGLARGSRSGRAAVALGAGATGPRTRSIRASGAVVLARPGDAVKEGDGLLEIHYRDGERLGRALEILAGGCPISDAKPEAGRLVLEVIE